MTINTEIVQLEDIISFEDVQDKETERLLEDILNTLEIAPLTRSNIFINSLIEQINFLDEGKVLVKEGIPCKMITPRKQGWTHGRLKLVLQFESNEVSASKALIDNPLDVIRNTSFQ